MTTIRAAAIGRCSVTTIRKLCQHGHLESRRIGVWRGRGSELKVLSPRAAIIEAVRTYAPKAGYVQRRRQRRPPQTPAPVPVQPSLVLEARGTGPASTSSEKLKFALDMAAVPPAYRPILRRVAALAPEDLTAFEGLL